MKKELKSLTGEYIWGQSNTDILFAQQKANLSILRHGLDVFGVKYGVFQTSDRGAALVQFNYLDKGDPQVPTGFSLTLQFIEDGLSFGCPRVVAKLVTDEAAKQYLIDNAKHIENIQPVGKRTTVNQFEPPEFGDDEMKNEALPII